MNQISKKELIQSFITEDDERFSIAIDIYENFESISDTMLEEILRSMISQLNVAKNWNLFLIESGQQANSYYFYVGVNLEYRLAFNCSYYFKTYEVGLQGNDHPFDSKNLEHIRLRELMKKEFPEAFEANWFIAAIKNSKYEMNIGDSYMDLFQVYKHRTTRSRFCDNFIERFAPIIERILNLIATLR